ncbi:uridine kinase [Gordoniibacillus kamchatkensis]|uniref:Uridine kinase n=1 Tax=Gordoniibacillus kamchatkensis TaxID=1590651 RepID=A0ABR5AH75_9BACL|nr:uridine kinase [Paenibacillus sp. VKM B-2647]KIL39925.1 uridine kinase [Paenibacillus sp. VKM B-2647]
MLVIGIAGGTGSGKTSVARNIMNKLGKDNVTLLSQDNYYIDHSELAPEEREKINYDHPNAFDNALLLAHLQQLREGRPIDCPKYDFTKHARSAQTIRIEVKPIVLIEGIHVLTDEQVRGALDIKVFVDTDPDVRILRRVVRDIQDRGRTLKSVYEQYLTTVKPMHDAFIEPSKKYADIIIPEGGHNEIGISLLTSLTERYMAESARPG